MNRKTRKDFDKTLMKCIKNFLQEGKTRSENMVMNKIKIFQKMKTKNWVFCFFIQNFLFHELNPKT